MDPIGTFNPNRTNPIQWQGEGHGLVNFNDDSRLVVMFFTKSILSPAKSRAANAPIYEDIIYVRMHEPGERLNVVERPVTENDKYRFPIHWNRFTQKLEQTPDGTPLDLLFPNNPSIADMLKANNITTVQQLAGLSAHAIDTVGMGSQEWVNLAKRYLEKAKEGADFHDFEAKLKARDQEMAVLKQQFDILQANYNALVEKFRDPLKHANQPNWQEGHDAQTERLNATHASTDVKPKKK